MARPIGERTASLETQMQNLETKVKEGFEKVTSELKDISAKIDQFHRENDARFATKEDVDEVKRIATTRSWLMGGAGTLVGVVVTIVVAIVIDYFKK